MAFEKQVPQWHAAGVEPPESLKQSGFAAGYKPPADYFNWFWHNVAQALLELQGMTPSDIGAAQDDQHKWKSYSALSQISSSLTFDSTPFEVASAMPDLSILAIPTSGSYSNAGGLIPQAENGVLIIKKASIARVAFEFVGETSGVYYAYLRSTENRFTGWVKVYSETNPPTAEDVGAIPTAGGTLAGSLTMQKVANGYAVLHKNHDKSNDYGTQLTDFDAAGNWLRLYLSALSGKVQIRDSANNIGYELYGQHNNDLLVEDIRHHFKLYSDLSQLGLTVGSETIEGIATSLNAYSRLVIPISSSNNTSIYPNSNNGLLVVEKSIPSRILFTFTNNNGGQWTGVYSINSSGNTWTGWIKVYGAKNKPTVSDIGAAPSSHVDDTDNPHGVTRDQLGMDTTLWNGSWTSGSITVPNTSNYRMFMISMSGQGTVIPVFRMEGHVRGIGGYVTSSGTVNTYQFAATIDGNKWTWVGCSSGSIGGSLTNRTVTKVWGLF